MERYSYLSVRANVGQVAYHIVDNDSVHDISTLQPRPDGLAPLGLRHLILDGGLAASLVAVANGHSSAYQDGLEVLVEGYNKNELIRMIFDYPWYQESRSVCRARLETWNESELRIWILTNSALNFIDGNYAAELNDLFKMNYANLGSACFHSYSKSNGKVNFPYLTIKAEEKPNHRLVARALGVDPYLVKVNDTDHVGIYSEADRDLPGWRIDVNWGPREDTLMDRNYKGLLQMEDVLRTHA